MNKKVYIVLVAIGLIVVIAVCVNYIFKKDLLSKKEGNLSLPKLTVLYDNAKKLEVEKSYLEAQAIYKEILEKTQDAEFTQKISKDLMDLNAKLLFSPIVT